MNSRFLLLAVAALGAFALTASAQQAPPDSPFSQSLDPAKIWPLSDASPVATPPPVVVNVQAPPALSVQPQAVQQQVLSWVNMLYIIIPAIVGLIGYIIAQVQALKGRADRQSLTTGAIQSQVTGIALATPPAQPLAPAPSGDPLAKPSSNAGSVITPLVAMLVKFAGIGCALTAMTGCLSTSTPVAATNVRNAQINAAGQAALVDSGRILGQFAVNSLMQAVQKDTKNGQSTAVTDLEQSGVQSLYSVTSSGTVDLSNIFTAASAAKATHTAAELAKIQAAQGASPAVASAAAAVIATATGAPPAP